MGERGTVWVREMGERGIVGKKQQQFKRHILQGNKMEMGFAPSFESRGNSHRHKTSFQVST